MTITEALHRDHLVTKLILENLIEQTVTATDDESDWRETLLLLRTAVFAHDRAEETVFYDWLGTIPHRLEVADQKTEEHHLIEGALDTLWTLIPADSIWETQVSILKNLLEGHISEEETAIFSVAEAAMSDDEAMQLARDFSRTRSELIEGFRTHPLAHPQKKSGTHQAPLR